MSEATVTLTAREYAEILLTLTLRDRFAMAALTGFMASGDAATGNDRAIAQLAYRFADAMLEARKEKK